MQADFQQIVKAQQEITQSIRDWEDAVNALTVHICLETGGTIRKDIENRELLLQTLDEIDCYCSHAVREIINYMGNLKKIASEAGWID